MVNERNVDAGQANMAETRLVLGVAPYGNSEIAVVRQGEPTPEISLPRISGDDAVVTYGSSELIADVPTVAVEAIDVKPVRQERAKRTLTKRQRRIIKDAYLGRNSSSLIGVELPLSLDNPIYL